MIITTEQFSAAYERLPFPIREMLASEDLEKIVQEVGNAHGLHIDIIGGLERETTNMLLGLINPTQFVGELKSVGIPQESIGAIVEELNSKIFIPLQEKMRNQPIEEDSSEHGVPPPSKVSTSSPTVQATPAPILISTPSVQVVPPAPAYIPPTPVAQPSVSQFSVPAAAPIPQSVPFFVPSVQAPVATIAPASVIPPAPVTPPVPIEPVILPTPPAPVPPVIPTAHVPARTMQHDMQIAQSAPITPPSREITSAPVRPSVIPPMPAPQSTQSENRDALHAVLKDYGIDPYREPPE